jgi:hypothetical protein
MTTTWTPEELDRIGTADELHIAAHRPNGSLDAYTTIWVVRVGANLYVRSWRGARGTWYRHALQSGAARIRSGGKEWDITVAQPADAPHEAIHHRYRIKYARYDPTYVEPMTGGPATAATLRLDPRETTSAHEQHAEGTR